MQISEKMMIENRVTEEFQKHYQKLFGMVYRMTENIPDTEDVLQNAFIKAYNNIDGFREESKLSTWLYRITVNESYRYLKTWNKLPVVSIAEKLGVSEKIFFESIDCTEAEYDTLIIEEMREKCMRGFLRCVPQNMRVCFLLKSCLELKNKEIAEIMDISESNAKVLLFRARQRLKEMFEYRCSLIDPDKPCKCYLWIKYMKDNGLLLPNEQINYKNKDLENEHFKNMELLKQIECMYHVEHNYTYSEFIERLKSVSTLL